MDLTLGYDKEALVENREALKEGKFGSSRIDFQVEESRRIIMFDNVYSMGFDVLGRFDTEDIAFELTIIGKGTLEKELKMQAENLRIAEKVKFIKDCSREEIREHLQQSHLLVSTSTFETFGLSIAEAHATGRPTVVLDAGGPAEFVNNKNGILVKDNNPQKIAEAVIKICKNYTEYDSNLISGECRSKYSEIAIREKLEEVYNRILMEK